MGDGEVREGSNVVIGRPIIAAGDGSLESTRVA